MKNQLTYKKTIKIICLIYLIIVLLFNLGNVCFADGTISTGGVTPDINNDFNYIGGVILGIIQVVGTAIGVIVIAIIGIRYMIGSVEEKAEYKKTFGYYVLGAVLLMGAVNIASIVYDIFW